jgi:hypothetical protein
MIISDKELKPEKVICERYLNGLDEVKDPSGYITELFWPIKGSASKRGLRLPFMVYHRSQEVGLP